ncbi:Smr/MutS family protein [Olivibacter domesticus]|uniref:Smr domain-containing protein n=1 Tax=Olivibacter domesticus TaxID=407022 RepID=A0A1H7MH10_OLID1|nr:Smr/MutS family protein [Olivibacter domesticus]SEL10381.1 hypothetical protein SAMN05661044_02000 [Olivibacter domesticus]
MNNKTIEVDLHLGAFMRNTNGLSGEEMLAFSIERMKSVLEKAIADNCKEIRFIHGQGRGLLKNRVYEELQTYLNRGKIRRFEPSFFNEDIVVVSLV